MKLIFKKDQDAHIQVLQEVDQAQKDFSYEDMIKVLIKTKKLEDPEVSDDFSDSEIKSIKSMVLHINNEVAGENSEPDDIDSTIEEEDEDDDIPF